MSEHLFTYDDHNRLTEIEESGVGVTIHAYNQADRRISTTTPTPGSSRDAQTTGRTYDIMGRVVGRNLRRNLRVRPFFIEDLD